jgi:MazG family protein
LRNWEQIKAEERRSNDKQGQPDGADTPAKETSLLDGVSPGLPATLQGFQLTRKAARIGFDWENVEGVFEKLNEEAGEVKNALKTNDPKKAEEELGDLLFAAINLARFLKVDPEIALSRANAKFSQRFRAMERLARERGREFKELPREEMEALWNGTKRLERKRSEAERNEARSKR